VRRASVAAADPASTLGTTMAEALAGFVGERRR
jgi:hypothetical protein